MLASLLIFTHDCWHMSRLTLQTAASSASPFKIMLYTLPLWAGSLVLMLFMPLTGFISSILIVFCLLILPFKSRAGACPQCLTVKTFPFSGFGHACKGCGQELVLRGKTIHLIEPRNKKTVAGSGRGHRPMKQ